MPTGTLKSTTSENRSTLVLQNAPRGSVAGGPGHTAAALVVDWIGANREALTDGMANVDALIKVAATVTQVELVF